MAYAKTITVKETLKELKEELKKSPAHYVPKIRMLIEIKKSERPLSKNELASLIGVNHNSIQTWRTIYINEGLLGLLKDGRIGFKPPILSKASHKKIEKILLSSEANFTSYKQLYHWVDSNLHKGINYNSLRHYVKREFGAKLKVARKSHIKKDEAEGILFKKTLKGTVRKR
jgi:predicted Zn-dependent protease